MTLYLAIDTATDLGSVAAGVPGEARAEVTFTDRRHASALMPAIEECLAEAGGSLATLTGVVIADGPGSFTGLRIGFATLKGILFASGPLEVHSAPSLRSAAWRALQRGDGPVAVLYDAYRGEVFAAVYDADRAPTNAGGTSIREVVPPMCGPIDALVEAASMVPRVAVGDGAVLYADRLREWIGEEPVGPPEGGPRAGTLLELMEIDGGVRHVSDPDAIEPTYGRQAAAQDRWEEAHGRRLPDSPGDRS
jgi:tRNA threonylcarbamoyladenosine biosynthesis protein TsaB